MFYTYMLRCEDNSIYTGYTNDINKRMKSHFSDNKNHAKYTKSHKPKNVEIVWQCKQKELACRLEYYIKTLTKKEKEELIVNNKICMYFKGKIDARRFYKIDIQKLLNKEYL